MLQNRLACARVAKPLFAAEGAFDVTIRELSKLGPAITVASEQMDLAAEATQEALEQFAGTLQSLVVARGRMIATHRALDQARSGIDGMAEVDFGGGGGKKPLFTGAEDTNEAVAA